jgi:2-dehydropantoate 2-reductase
MLTTEETVIGGSSTETVQNIANRLTEAGIRTEVCGDAEPYIWDKQFLNVAVKPIAALTELRNGPMIEYPETREIMRRLVEEAVTVAKGMDVEILSDDPVGDVINRDLSEAGKDKKSSILEDVENERPTEIDHINGAVVDYGTEIDVETPYNKMATDLVSGKERGYQE